MPRARLLLLALFAAPASGDFFYASFNATTALALLGAAAVTTCDDGGPYLYASTFAAAAADPAADGPLVVAETASVRRVTSSRTLAAGDRAAAAALAAFPDRADFEASPDARGAGCLPRLRLTPSRPFKVGGVARAAALPVLGGWETGFTFQLTDPSRACAAVKDAAFGTASHRTCSVAGGDGLAFVLHGDGNGSAALGGGGGGLGYDGLRNALAVEFDSWFNAGAGWEDADVPFDHIAVQVTAPGGPDAGAGARTLSARAGARASGAPLRAQIADGLVHAVRIAYYPYLKYDFVPRFAAGAPLEALLTTEGDAAPLGTLAVWYDEGGGAAGCGSGACAGEAPRGAPPPLLPSLALPINLARALRVPGGDAFAAITAATGATAWQKHDVLSWYWCGAPGCPDAKAARNDGRVFTSNVTGARAADDDDAFAGGARR